MAGIEDLVTLYRGEPMLGESRYLKALNQTTTHEPKTKEIQFFL